MRGRLIAAIAAMVSLCACSADDRASRTFGAVEDPRVFWEEMAPTCAGYPSKEHCDDGDMALFGALLCASGDDRGCRLVRDAQGANGRWWRSPRRRDGNLGEDKSFSRDMAMGVMTYLAVTRDAAAAERWVAWIERNRPCLAHKPTGGCLVRGPYRFCTDDENESCALTPANWANLARVFEELGLAKTEEMRRYDGLDTETHWRQAQQAPLGYQTHLTAVEVLMKQLLQSGGATRRRAAAILRGRQPQNPFFEVLHDGPSPALAARVEALCPKREYGPPTRRFQWSWERDTASRAWEESMGWDCLFIDSLARGPDRR